MILLETLWRRWYAVLFVAAFFWAASTERGWKRALRFLCIASTGSYLAALTSVDLGFPFGRLEFLAQTRGEEVWIGPVPLFVPVVAGVILWGARSLAIAGLGARSQGAVIAATAGCAVALHLAIDPVTIRGNRWFLGLLYEYDRYSGWFAVPWTSFAGLFVVAAVILWFDELFEGDEEHFIDPIRGPTLAFGLAGLHVLVALFSTLFAVAIAGTVVTAALFFAVRPRLAALVRELEGPETAPASG